MLRIFLFTLVCFSLATNLACSTTEAPNTNSVGTANRIDPANIPPEFSSTPINANGASIPGITDPNNANKVPTGNIPGIPDPNKKTPQPKNTPPIPGIPSEEEIRRQMNTPLQDVNVVNNPPKNQQSDANSRPANKRGNTRQP